MFRNECQWEGRYETTTSGTLGAVVLDIKSVRNVDQGVRTLTFKIGGIECASCSTSELHELNGVEIAIVSPLRGQSVVKYIPVFDHIYNCFKASLGRCKFNFHWVQNEVLVGNDRENWVRSLRQTSFTSNFTVVSTPDFLWNWWWTQVTLEVPRLVQ
ncbi:hypothetical protein Hanom_Chr07g00629841 [Helianthus anomalus]